jgi:hypothetical protein
LIFDVVNRVPLLPSVIASYLFPPAAVSALRELLIIFGIIDTVYWEK